MCRLWRLSKPKYITFWLHNCKVQLEKIQRYEMSIQYSTNQFGSFKSENHYRKYTYGWDDMSISELLYEINTDTNINWTVAPKRLAGKTFQPPPKNSTFKGRAAAGFETKEGAKKKKKEGEKNKNRLVGRKREREREEWRTVERGPFWMSSVSLATGPRPSKAPWAQGLFERSPLFSAASFITVTT